MQIREWKIEIGDRRKISCEVIKEAENFLLDEWLPAFMAQKRDDKWWGLERGVPSPLLRIDMAPFILSDKETPLSLRNKVYEVEVRPAGLGLCLTLLNHRIDDWKEVFRAVECKGFVHIESTIQDDRIAARILGMPFYDEVPLMGDAPYWVRTNLREGPIVERLEDISLAPIKLDGDKTYLLRLGLAKVLDMERLKWNEPFVLKPLIGARLEKVEIYIPGRKKDLPEGVSTKSRILRRIAENGPFIIQNFIPPQEEKIEGIKGWTIWRLYFGWFGDFKRSGRYKSIGGLWNWRPNLRVHGSEDAIFGGLDI